MKRFIFPFLAAFALLAAPSVRAWNYNNGDLLLVFRNGAEDVEFDIGSVTNYLGHTNGYTVTVPGWSSNLVVTTYGSFSGLDFALVAAAGGTNWLSSADPNYTAYNISSSQAQTLGNYIAAVGDKTLSPLAIPTASTNAYAIDVTGQYEHSSYDYIVSGGTFNGIPQFDGVAQFAVEQAVPGYVDFWAVNSTTVYPGSPADSFIGTFYINATGLLTFVAGPRPSTIYGLTHAGTITSLQFSTIVGKTYSISYTNQLGAPVSKWPVQSATLIGDGHIDILNHTNTSTAEYFNISAQ